MSSSSTVEKADISLIPNFDPSQLNCLNEASAHTLKEMIKSPNAYLESDADEQLILNIHFLQKVRVKSITLRTSEAAKDQAPKDILLFINKPSLGFEDVEDNTAVIQKITLSPEDAVKGASIPLRYVKFQNVHSLHIFVSTNAGDAETTRIDSLDVVGSLNEVPKDVSNLGKEEEHDH
ncbi:DUF1000-domain-containing protein [Schizopora paradoxa]|uniref:DUF1000-domain-containing protein n=1 Tax=Schizopora paradoxa TaxID=27342 RepID=A0A0H2S8N5_9AGAM|nr:DUF1000-domain-containing protein [Schizopora paradoxa]